MILAIDKITFYVITFYVEGERYLRNLMGLEFGPNNLYPY